MTAPLRDAATVLVLRAAGQHEPQLLLVRRHARSGFAARAWVFPGGVMDPADTTLDPSCWQGADPAALAPVMGRTPAEALGLCVAAVRETFEEAGLLFARRAGGEPIDLGDPDVTAARREPAGFHDWLRKAGVVLDLGALLPYSRWRTPTEEPRRYDTIFFTAVAPEGQVADLPTLPNPEVTESRWLTAAEALAADDRGELPMVFPTHATVVELAGLGGLDAIRAAVPAGTRLRPLQPHMEVDDDGRLVRILHPDDAAYPRELYRDLAT